MRHYQIAVLPGDGIGPEVITESVKTLEALAEVHCGFPLNTQYFDWDIGRYLCEGALMPQDRLAVLDLGDFDCILLGPVGDPRVPDHLTLWVCCFRSVRGSTSMTICGLCACFRACRAPGWEGSSGD